MDSRLPLDVARTARRSRGPARAAALVAAAGLMVFAIAAAAGPAGAKPTAAFRPVEKTKGGSATAVAGKTRATWGLGPASLVTGKKGKHLGIDGRPDYKWFVSPGATLHDHVAIENLTTRALKLYVYARDATNAPNGQLALQPRSATPTGLGAWVTIHLPHHLSYVVVGPRATVFLPFTVQVPTSVTPGDYTGGVISALNAKVTTKGGESVAPTLAQRVAVPMIARVSGPLHPRLSIEDLHASYRGTANPIGDGHASLSYRVVNTGNVNLGANQQISIRGLFGTTAHVRAPAIPALLPGSAETITVPLASVFPEFVETAKVTLTPLVPSGDVDGPVAQPAASAHFWAIPWLLILLVLLFVALVVFEWRRRRSAARNKKAPAASSGRRIDARPNASEAT